MEDRHFFREARPVATASFWREDGTVVEDGMVSLLEPLAAALVPRSIAVGATTIPRSITPQMITKAFSAFVAKCGAAFHAEGLISEMPAELTAAERQNLPAREHIRACEAALARLTKFIPGLFAGPESDCIAQMHQESFRLHDLGMCLFHNLLSNLLSGLEMMPVETILVPGCGKLFEGSVLDAFFAPRTIIGQDTDVHALCLALQHNANRKSVVLQNVDSAKRPGHHAKDADMAMFIHPDIVDTAYCKARIDSAAYEQEDFEPLAAVRAKLCIRAIAQNWKDIINTTVARLRRGALLVFVFYEMRELELMVLYLRTLVDSIVVERTFRGLGLTTWAFVEPCAAHDPRHQPETYEFLAMRNYHCGLVARAL